MEKIRAFRLIVIVIAVLLAAELGMMVLLFRPQGFLMWANLAIVAVLCLYLVRVCFGLLKELEETKK